METPGREFINIFVAASDRQKQLSSLMDDQGTDNGTRLAILLWIWNYLSLESDNHGTDSDASFIKECITNLQNTVLLPVRADLVHLTKGWTVIFSMKQGTSKQLMRAWTETRKKIVNLVHFEPEQGFFESERERLIETLQILSPKR